MQRYTNNASTKIKAPTPDAGTCPTTSVNNVLNYILVFFLVLLVCYAFVYLYRIYTQPRTPETQKKEQYDNVTSSGTSGTRNAIIGLFWDQCGHCKRFRPIFDDVMSKYKNVDAFKREWSLKVIEDTNEAKTKYNVSSFPTVVVIKNDVVVETKSGGMTDSDFHNFIRGHVGFVPVQQETR